MQAFKLQFTCQWLLCHFIQIPYLPGCKMIFFPLNLALKYVGSLKFTYQALNQTATNRPASPLTISASFTPITIREAIAFNGTMQSQTKLCTATS